MVSVSDSGLEVLPLQPSVLEQDTFKKHSTVVIWGTGRSGRA